MLENEHQRIEAFALQKKKTFVIHILVQDTLLYCLSDRAAGDMYTYIGIVIT